MATDISICNTAIVIAGGGENSIQTFDDETREARLCSQIYETTKDTLISKHPWSFTLGEVQLARLADTPVLDDYEYVYQLPTSPKLIRLIRTETPGEDYRVYEDKLYSNFTSRKIVYQFDPGEENYPAYFVRALELRLAEILALSLAQDETFSDQLERKAFRAFKEARYVDSSNTPPRHIDDNNLALISVR